MQSFKGLTDASKLNKKPQRVRIKTLNKKPQRVRIKTITANTTLKQALTQYKVPNERMEEFAILNGMQLSQTLTKGMLIKVIEY